MAIYYDVVYYPHKTFQQSVSLFAQPAAWMGLFVSPSVLAAPELIQGSCHHKNNTTALPSLSWAACGSNKALIRKCRVTMIYSACIGLLGWNEIQPKTDFLSPVGQHREQRN